MRMLRRALGRPMLGPRRCVGESAWENAGGVPGRMFAGDGAREDAWEDANM